MLDDKWIEMLLHSALIFTDLNIQNWSDWTFWLIESPYLMLVRWEGHGRHGFYINFAIVFWGALPTRGKFVFRFDALVRVGISPILDLATTTNSIYRATMKDLPQIEKNKAV